MSKTTFPSLSLSLVLLGICLGLTACDELADSAEPSDATSDDQDGDGYDASWAGGDDCDDDDSSIHPYAGEDCEGSIDHDCDGDVGYDDDDCCSLSCSCSGGSLSAGLSCGTGSSSCNYSYDSYGRVDYISCSYSNGTSFSCALDYNSLGQASGDCDTSYGGGDSCSFSCS